MGREAISKAPLWRPSSSWVTTGDNRRIPSSSLMRVTKARLGQSSGSSGLVNLPRMMAVGTAERNRAASCARTKFPAWQGVGR